MAYPFQKRANFDSDPVGTENWNVAEGFTSLKILKPMVECDKLILIAKYGAWNIEESLTLPLEIKTDLRLEAILRLIDALKLIIENSVFACKEKDRDKLKDLRKQIVDVEKYVGAIKSVKINQQTKKETITINEKHFGLCLDKLRAIKEMIYYPINQNGLIFRTSEEVDLDKIKNELIEGG